MYCKRAHEQMGEQREMQCRDKANNGGGGMDGGGGGGGGGGGAGGGGSAIGRETSLQLIDTDLPRTFPKMQLFGRDDAFHARLRQVLEAYTCSRPDLGYIQGMSYLAAMLSLYARDSFEAFKCLANMMVSSTIIVLGIVIYSSPPFTYTYSCIHTHALTHKRLSSLYTITHLLRSAATPTCSVSTAWTSTRSPA